MLALFTITHKQEYRLQISLSYYSKKLFFAHISQDSVNVTWQLYMNNTPQWSTTVARLTEGLGWAHSATNLEVLSEYLNVADQTSSKTKLLQLSTQSTVVETFFSHYHKCQPYGATGNTATSLSLMAANTTNICLKFGDIRNHPLKPHCNHQICMVSYCIC